jgi:hypothetical protein
MCCSTLWRDAGEIRVSDICEILYIPECKKIRRPETQRIHNIFHAFRNPLSSLLALPAPHTTRISRRYGACAACACLCVCWSMLMLVAGGARALRLSDFDTSFCAAFSVPRGENPLFSRLVRPRRAPLASARGMRWTLSSVCLHMVHVVAGAARALVEFCVCVCVCVMCLFLRPPDLLCLSLRPRRAPLASARGMRWTLLSVRLLVVHVVAGAPGLCAVILVLFF